MSDYNEFWERYNQMGGGERDKVLVEFVLDRSGSMSIVRDETVRSFNRYINELKKDKDVDYIFSMSVFNHNYKRLFENKPINEVPDLTTRVYDPDGMTALNDAVGKTINLIGSVPDNVKVMVAVLTDGHENASREFVANTSVQKLIAEKEALPNWTFVFLGTEADAWDVGRDLGFSPNNITSTIWTVSGTNCMFDNFVGATQYYHGASAADYKSTGAFKGLNNMSTTVSADFWDADTSNTSKTDTSNISKDFSEAEKAWKTFDEKNSWKAFNDKEEE